MSFPRDERDKKPKYQQFVSGLYNPPRGPYANLAQYPASKIHYTVRSYQPPKRTTSPNNRSSPFQYSQQPTYSSNNYFHGPTNSPVNQPRYGQKQNSIPVYQASTGNSGKFNAQPQNFSSKYFNNHQTQQKPVSPIMQKKYDLKSLLQDSFSSSDSDSLDSFLPQKNSSYKGTTKSINPPHLMTREEIDELLEDSSDSDFEDRLRINSIKSNKSVPRKHSIVPIYDLSSSSDSSEDDEILRRFSSKKRQTSIRDNKSQKRPSSFKNREEDFDDSSDDSTPAPRKQDRKASHAYPIDLSDDSSSISSIDLPSKYSQPKKSKHSIHQKKTVSGILEITDSYSDESLLPTDSYSQKSSQKPGKSARNTSKSKPMKSSSISVTSSFDSEMSNSSNLKKEDQKAAKPNARSIIYDTDSDTSVSDFIARQSAKIKNLTKKISDSNKPEEPKKEEKEEPAARSREIINRIKQGLPVDSEDSNEEISSISDQPKSILKNPKATKTREVTISSDSSDFVVESQDKKSETKSSPLLDEDDGDEMSSADELIKRVNARIAGFSPSKQNQQQQKDSDSKSSLFDEEEKQPPKKESPHKARQAIIKKVEEEEENDENDFEEDTNQSQKEEEEQNNEEIKKDDFDDSPMQDPTDEDTYKEEEYAQKITKLQKFIKSIKIAEEEDEEEEKFNDDEQFNDEASNIDQELNTSLKKNNLNKINLQDIAEDEEEEQIPLKAAPKIKVGSSNTSIQKIGDDVIIERDSEKDEIRFSGPPSPTAPSFAESTDSEKKKEDANEGSEVLPPNDEENSGIEPVEEDEIDEEELKKLIAQQLPEEEEDLDENLVVKGTQTPEKSPREQPKKEQKVEEEEEDSLDASELMKKIDELDQLSFKIQEDEKRSQSQIMNESKHEEEEEEDFIKSLEKRVAQRKAELEDNSEEEEKENQIQIQKVEEEEEDDGEDFIKSLERKVAEKKAELEENSDEEDEEEKEKEQEVNEENEDDDDENDFIKSLEKRVAQKRAELEENSEEEDDDENDLIKDLEKRVSQIKEQKEEEEEEDDDFDIEKFKKENNIHLSDDDEEEENKEQNKTKNSNIVINDAELMKSNDEEIDEEISANSADLQTQTKEEKEGIYMKLSKDEIDNEEEDDFDDDTYIKKALEAFGEEISDEDI
ncbi:hypothetical protein TVAG_478780 [Trichomonas vaginalis G3]|uniref:Uncharacterized protein n=1 Tax=Trichomonas vaginalis (strain ATCC PRA-98 / G3) TaxID=412133 RepID=A2DZZ4_TRIV3|nr:hypothetical protein TVAGG3_0536070 [Trichomonas vaginalis G3]EAY14053.1 hypothetical protein TVAG_478780 [Trichomonas vaginalis G3]KAI5519505.1 hypothetical protein TVAGG3_0536070 [Trichomonas vaginalis G3]|eukprot:XP_001326276.1 hypothetical protein [Trichomonas vaginalis G3]